jgi:hypothetical protein
VQVLKDQTRHFYVTPDGARGTPRQGFKSFDDARSFVRAQHLPSYAAWWRWSRLHPDQRRAPACHSRHLMLRILYRIDCVLVFLVYVKLDRVLPDVKACVQVRKETQVYSSAARQASNRFVKMEGLS